MFEGREGGMALTYLAALFGVALMLFTNLVTPVGALGIAFVAFMPLWLTMTFNLLKELRTEMSGSYPNTP